MIKIIGTIIFFIILMVFWWLGHEAGYYKGRTDQLIEDIEREEK